MTREAEEAAAAQRAQAATPGRVGLPEGHEGQVDTMLHPLGVAPDVTFREGLLMGAFVCNTCGALVEDRDRDTHQAWHRRTHDFQRTVLGR